MRRALFLSLVLLSAPSLFAIEIFPPLVDSHTGVRIKFLAGGCPPIAHVSITGSTIRLTSTDQPGSSCIATRAPSPAVAIVGPLAPGVYTIETELGEHGQLIVRDAGSDITVSPVGISTSAGRIVQIFSDRAIGGKNTSVTFGGLPATVESFTGEHSVVVTPPPHAAGTVDVTMTDEAGTEKAVAAFTYFDPAAPVDRQIFEPLLYPVAYDGPGVFGSQWATENEIGTGNTAVRFRDLQQVSPCDGACGALNWSGLLARQSRSGLLVWTVRRRIPAGLEIDDELRVSSRIIESSHPDEIDATLPVARERDFRHKLVFSRIPVGTDARVTLRLYALGGSTNGAGVFIDRGGAITMQPVGLPDVNGIGFGMLDIAPQGGRTVPTTITVFSFDKIYGLITVTNNATQRITAFSPQ